MKRSANIIYENRLRNKRYDRFLDVKALEVFIVNYSLISHQKVKY